MLVVAFLRCTSGLLLLLLLLLVLVLFKHHLILGAISGIPSPSTRGSARTRCGPRRHVAELSPQIASTLSSGRRHGQLHLLHHLWIYGTRALPVALSPVVLRVRRPIALHLLHRLPLFHLLHHRRVHGTHAHVCHHATLSRGHELGHELLHALPILSSHLR